MEVDGSNDFPDVNWGEFLGKPAIHLQAESSFFHPAKKA